MQITPLEAFDIVSSIELTNQLVQTLQETADKYRLWQDPPGNGLSHYTRRYYTCPFFDHKPGGCLLPPEVKPYGCLGFNPQIEKVSQEGLCHSDQDLLEKRDQFNPTWENEENQKIKEKFNINWDKKPIPIALLELIKKEILYNVSGVLV